MENKEGVGVDAILSEIGLGKWQLFQYFWLCLFFVAWSTQQMAIIVIGFSPDVACLPNVSRMAGNGTESFGLQFGQTCSWYDSSSNTSRPCDGNLFYSEPKHVSIVSEWDLSCGGAYLSDLSQTMLTAGMAVGTVFFSPLADRFGRRRIIIGAHSGLLIVSLATTLVPNITLFIVCRAILGAFLAGCGAALWVTVLELFIPRHRTAAAMWGNVLYSVSTCVLPGIGYAMRGLNWRHFQLAISVLSLSLIGHFLWVDEPIRWLLANGKNKEANTIVQKALKLNRVDRSRMTVSEHQLGDLLDEQPSVKETNFSLIRNQVPDVDCVDHNPLAARVTLMDMVTNPHLRRINAIITIAWFSNALIYGGLYMLTSVMAGDRYLNLFLSTVVEIPASLASIPLIMKFGRRKVCVVLHLLAGVALITAISIFFTTGTTADVIEICVVVLGKFSISGSYNLLYMYTPELYPTNIRSSGLGVASVASRVGGLIYPFTITVARELRWLPSTIFGVLCFVVAFCCWFLPETANRDLPQTLEDMDMLFEETKSTKKKDELTAKEC